MTNMIVSFFVNSILYILAFAFLFFLILTDIYISQNNKRRFLITILLCSLHLLSNFLSLWTENNSCVILIPHLFSYIGYILRPFIIYCFACLIFPNSKHSYLFAASCVNFIMYATTHFTHLCVYYVDSNFHRAPLGYVIFIMCGLALGYITLNSILHYYQKHVRRWMLPPICSIIIVYAVYYDFKSHSNVYPTGLSQALILVLFLFYIFYHLQLEEQYQEKILQNQQLQLMISQIKPHFFFNAITTIQALCFIDPKKASDTLGTFATYIRQNITPPTVKIIPFSQEIEHVEAYVSIEELRFPNIEVLYDLEVTDFVIAPLSIQPLVENSIKHGIRSREHGIVLISTRRLNNMIIITIKDNGVGFDTKILENLDETHVGVNNVRTRLLLLQNAQMKIESNTEGTTITIILPLEN